jgi:hypothetical protein
MKQLGQWSVCGQTDVYLSMETSFRTADVATVGVSTWITHYAAFIAKQITVVDLKTPT